MRVAVSATGHYESFPGVVNNFCLILIDKGFDSLLVADVYIFSVLHSKRFNELVAL